MCIRERGFDSVVFLTADQVHIRDQTVRLGPEYDLRFLTDSLGSAEGISHQICEIIEKRVARLHQRKPFIKSSFSYMRRDREKRNALFRHRCISK